MVEKGTYCLDFESPKVIIDGHEFVQTEYEGIYECIDEYKVYGEDWAYDDRNEDLCIYVKVPRNSSRGLVLYVCKWDNPERDRIWADKFYGRNTKEYTFDFTECVCHECFKNGFMGGMPIL